MESGFIVGIRTNGYLALEKMPIIQSLNGEIGYSMHSLIPVVNFAIMRKENIPEWETIIPLSGDNVRISIVVNVFNVREILTMIKAVSSYDNVRYVQLRRISTETRAASLKHHIEIFDDFEKWRDTIHPSHAQFAGARIFKIHDKDVVLWKTVETSADSLNYFTDGVVSDEYFVVEGYLKNLREGD